MAMGKKKNSKTLEIPKQKIQIIDIYVGGPELCVHRFAQKARQEILARQQQAAQTKKLARDPHAEYLASKYIDQSGKWEGVPAAAFRRAIIDAASFVDGVTKVHLRGAVFVVADGKDADNLNIIQLHAKSERMREDVVRLPNGSADLRYRAYYEDWACKLQLRLDPDIISAEQLHHLVERAGFSIGLCEARPQKSGEWGQYSIITKGAYDKLPPCLVSRKAAKAA